MDFTMDLTHIVRSEMDRLDIPPTIRGHRYLTYIIGQVVISPERITGMTKDLYRETANRFHTSWTAVERNSRTAVMKCWSSTAGRDRLCKLTRCQLMERPTLSVFVAVVAGHVADNYQLG